MPYPSSLNVEIVFSHFHKFAWHFIAKIYADETTDNAHHIIMKMISHRFHRPGERTTTKNIFTALRIVLNVIVNFHMIYFAWDRKVLGTWVSKQFVCVEIFKFHWNLCKIVTSNVIKFRRLFGIFYVSYFKLVLFGWFPFCQSQQWIETFW